MPGWTVADMPDQTGRTAVVTGANGGLGFEVARALAGAGAHVVLACRNLDKATEAVGRIRAEHEGASVEVVECDLSAQASVRDAAAAIRAAHDRVDLLVDNAGIMAAPHRSSADGWELQLATNHLGHYALTGLVLDRMLPVSGSRVVVVTSAVHRAGRIDLDDLQSRHRYGRWRAYAQSKLANVLFALELQRRLARSAADTIAVSAHPGYAGTDLQLAGPRMSGSALRERVASSFNRLFAQSPAAGALPSLYAATAPGMAGGELIGPGGPGELRGAPRAVAPSRRAGDPDLAERLWEVSEDLTGVRFDL